MDPTTIMAIICSILVFAGWLFLPHAPKAAKRDLVVSTAKPDLLVSEERERVAVSA